MTSSEIAFAIFIAKHNLPMAVGDEFGLLAKKMWCSTVPVAHPGGCPAFSFVDVDTYTSVRHVDLGTKVQWTKRAKHSYLISWLAKVVACVRITQCSAGLISYQLVYHG